MAEAARLVWARPRLWPSHTLTIAGKHGRQGPHRGRVRSDGGAIGVSSPFNVSTITVKNSILASNDPATCAVSNGTITDGAHNLVFGTRCAAITAFSTADPLLGALADNGRPTQTRAIADTSPARDAVPPPAPAAPRVISAQRRSHSLVVEVEPRAEHERLAVQLARATREEFDAGAVPIRVLRERPRLDPVPDVLFEEGCAARRFVVRQTASLVLPAAAARALCASGIRDIALAPQAGERTERHAPTTSLRGTGTLTVTLHAPSLLRYEIACAAPNDARRGASDAHGAQVEPLPALSGKREGVT